MIDITDEIQVEDSVPVPGKWSPSLILYHGIRIGHMECQGPVADNIGYFFAYKPNRLGVHEFRYYKLEPHEVPE